MFPDLFDEAPWGMEVMTSAVQTICHLNKWSYKVALFTSIIYIQQKSLRVEVVAKLDTKGLHRK